MCLWVWHARRPSRRQSWQCHETHLSDSLLRLASTARRAFWRAHTVAHQQNRTLIQALYRRWSKFETSKIHVSLMAEGEDSLVGVARTVDPTTRPHVALSRVAYRLPASHEPSASHNDTCSSLSCALQKHIAHAEGLTNQNLRFQPRHAVFWKKA